MYSVDCFDMNNYAERNYYIAALSTDGSVKAAETLDSGLFGSKAIGDKFYGMIASLDASNEYVAIDPDTAEVSPIGRRTCRMTIRSAGSNPVTRAASG